MSEFIIEIVNVEARDGSDMFDILNACYQLARLRHATVKTELKGLKISVNEHACSVLNLG